MAIRTELNLRLPNSPGALAAVCRTLADERVNIVALSVEPSGHLRLVVDNHVRAAGALRERHHQVSEREVVVTSVGIGPGALAPVLELVAGAGVNVDTPMARRRKASAARQSSLASNTPHAPRPQRASEF